MGFRNPFRRRDQHLEALEKLAKGMSDAGEPLVKEHAPAPEPAPLPVFGRVREADYLDRPVEILQMDVQDCLKPGRLVIEKVTPFQLGAVMALAIEYVQLPVIYETIVAVPGLREWASYDRRTAWAQQVADRIRRDFCDAISPQPSKRQQPRKRSRR